MDKFKPINIFACVSASYVRSKVAVCAALVFLAAPNLTQAASLNLGPLGEGVITGSEPFNTSGQCHQPGDDCGSKDLRVRTGDLVQFMWSITANDIAADVNPLSAVIMEQTVRSSDNAVVTFDRVPTICLPPPAGLGGTNPISSIVNNSDGSHTLICNLGTMGSGEQKSFSVPIRPSASSEDGSSFTSQQKVYALNDAGKKIIPDQTYNDTNTYTISAAPAFDLMADRSELFQGQRIEFDMGLGDGPEPGYIVNLSAHIAADELRGAKGLAALGSHAHFNLDLSATLKDGVTPYDLPFSIVECRPNSIPAPNSVYGNEQIAIDESINRKVIDSGSCVINGDHVSGYRLNLFDLVSDAKRFPTESIGGQSLALGPYFIAAYQIKAFIPFSAIEASDGDLSGNGGALNVSTCFTEFDPNSRSGVSNYGDGVEPGFNGALMPDGSASNNCAGPLTLKLTVGGGFNHRLVKTVDDFGEYTLAPMIDVEHTGNTAVQVGTAYAHMERFINDGSKPLQNFKACFKFDNTVSELVDASQVGASADQYAFIAQDKSGDFDVAAWRVEYGIADFNADNPLDYNADGTPDFDASSGRYFGTWDAMRDARCVDSMTKNWVSDPADIGAQNVNVVRFVGPVVNPGQTFRALLPLRMRSFFNGGPHSGKAIPVGTVAAAVSSFRSDEFYPEWRPVMYSPAPESSHGDGDRVTFTRVSVDATLSSQLPLAAAGETKSVLAGNDVVWQLNASVKSNLPVGGTALGLQLVQVLPLGSSYNKSCSQQMPNGIGPTRIRYNIPDKGQQTLIWNLGDVHSTVAPEPIHVCTTTESFANDGEVISSTVFAQANNATPSEKSIHTIALGQAGSVKAAVAVDVMQDNLDDDQVHTLSWMNFSQTDVFEKPVVINVFAYTGDEAGLSSRHPGSTFSGTLQLQQEPVVQFFDGSAPLPGENVIGTLFYTGDAPASVDHNARTNNNRWCVYENKQFKPLGNAGDYCPKTLQDVTAIKFHSNYDLGQNGTPQQGVKIQYTLAASGNKPGEQYSNVFGLASTSLPDDQLIKGRVATVTTTSYSIGDFVFVDVNQDGKYTRNVDVTAPDGLQLELRNNNNDAVIGSTHTKAGLFVFDLLPAGDYYVQIPAHQFTPGQPLHGWSAAPNGQPASANGNHTTDHSAIVDGEVESTGIRTSVVTLASDELLNLTIDLGLVSGDADGDGLPDILEFGSNTLSHFVDSDSDGTPDYQDTDSDNDGINDAQEAGELASFDAALLAAAISDSLEAGGFHLAAGERSIRDLFQLAVVDSDSDGIADYLDIDSDNDLIPDAIEVGSAFGVAVDSDDDGVPDYLDNDSDNDSVSDTIEYFKTLTPEDTNGNGIVDVYDVMITGGNDENGDGIDDHFGYVDSGESAPLNTNNYAAVPNTSDNNLVGATNPDWMQANPDTDVDGIPDWYEGTADTDSDGVPDYLDLDSDDDSVPDAVESGIPSTDHAFIAVLDTDGDGVDDYRDLDSDNDSIPDAVEGAIDTDGDGIRDFLDTDSNNDTISDAEQGTADTNGNAVQDRLELAFSESDDLSNALTFYSLVYVVSAADSDGDGISDDVENASSKAAIEIAIIAGAENAANAPQVQQALDSDNDAIPDRLDLDSDNDGIPDILEAGPYPANPADTDGDGIINSLDLDSDNDGIPDSVESYDLLEGNLADTDTDGTPDYLDLDSDNDLIPDALETNGDADGDGIPNRQDRDSDNDRLPDLLEQSFDTDGDGIADYQDSDSDGDSVPDVMEAGQNDMAGTLTLVRDSDADGIADFRDLDSDNDGIADAIEAGARTLSAGTPGFYEYILIDTDQDGIPDLIDLDSDNDAIPDAIEGSKDTDGDGIRDFLDTDSNNDSVSDVEQTNADNNGNAIPDRLEIANTQLPARASSPVYLVSAIDSDGDGISDEVENASSKAASELEATAGSDSVSNGAADAGNRDSDNDGIPDRFDLDSDNDGIPDILEAGPDSSNPADTDRDGVINSLDLDSDNDGIPDSAESYDLLNGELADSDADGTPDYLDLDSDNDLIPDALETNEDADGDGIPNRLDLDSDNDQVPDQLEKGFDADSDGIVDFLDTVDNRPHVMNRPNSEKQLNSNANASINIDTNAESNSSSKTLSQDSDGDGIFDSLEGEGDFDKDLIPNKFDLDSDNDGILDRLESVGKVRLLDSDGDGLPNVYDRDSDNDGISDTAESIGPNFDLNVDGVIDDFLDLDLNGVDDGIDAIPAVLTNADYDDIPDYLDIDSDNDGTFDLVEAGGVDLDNDGILDSMVDIDNDGIPNFIDVDFTVGNDADGDGIDDVADVDFIDGALDDDDDGIANAFDIDSNGDGFADRDKDPSMPGAIWPDNNLDSIPDIKQQGNSPIIQNNVLITTGLDGQGLGCRFSSNKAEKSDPSLLIILLAAFIVLLCGSQTRVGRSSFSGQT